MGGKRGCPVIRWPVNGTLLCRDLNCDFLTPKLFFRSQNASRLDRGSGRVDSIRSRSRTRSRRESKSTPTPHVHRWRPRGWPGHSFQEADLHVEVGPDQNILEHFLVNLCFHDSLSWLKMRCNCHFLRYGYYSSSQPFKY